MTAAALVLLLEPVSIGSIVYMHLPVSVCRQGLRCTQGPSPRTVLHWNLRVRPAHINCRELTARLTSEHFSAFDLPSK